MAQQSITLQTSDADVISGDILGRVNFAASNESSGSEARWIGASVYAEASGEFTATVNPTNLVFATSDADGIVARHRVTNVGHFVPLLNTTYNLGASASKYNNIFAATGTLDRVATTGIQLTGSASQSGLLYINNSNLISSSPNVLFSNADLASPKLIFKASGTTTPDLSLNILTTASGTTSGVQTLSVQGSAGELFSITDVLDSGTIFSVNDISGLSLIEADASGVVTLVRYGTNVAVGDFTPTQKLHVGGNLRVSGAYYDSLNSPGTSGQVLVSTAVGTDWKTLSEIVGVDGVGTSGYLARWIDAETISSGIIYDNGTNIGIGTASPSQKLHVNGDIRLDQSIFATQSNLQFLTPGGFALPIKVGSLTISTTYGGVDAPTSGLYVQGRAGIGTISPTAKLHIETGSTTTTGVIVRGIASQTADLQQWQNSAGTALARVDAAGSISGVASGIFMGRVGVGTSTPDGALDVVTDTNGSFYFGNKDDTPKVNTIVFRQATHSSEPEGYAALCNTSIDNSFNSLSIGGGSPNHNAFTSINLMTASDSSVRQGTTRLRIISNGNVGIAVSTPVYPLDVRGSGYFSNGVVTSGRIGINITETTPTAMLDVRSNSATVTGVIVRGAASQSADLLQIQNSTPATLVRVDAAGSISGVASGLFNYIGLNNPPVKYSSEMDIVSTGVKAVNTIMTINDLSNPSILNANLIGYSYRSQPASSNYSGVYTGFRSQLVDSVFESNGIRNDLGYATHCRGVLNVIENVRATGYGVYTVFTPNDTNQNTFSKAVGYYMDWSSDGQLWALNPDIIGVEVNIDDSTSDQSVNIYALKATLAGGPTSTVYGFYISGGDTSYLSHNLGLGRLITSAKLDLETAGNIGIITRGSAGQTADLQQWLNVSSGVLLRVDAAGSISGVASGIFDQNLRVANIPAGSSETDVVLVKSDGTFVKRPSSSLGVGGGSGISNEDSIINALIFG